MRSGVEYGGGAALYKITFSFVTNYSTLHFWWFLHDFCEHDSRPTYLHEREMRTYLEYTTVYQDYLNETCLSSFRRDDERTEHQDTWTLACRTTYSTGLPEDET